MTENLLPWNHTGSTVQMKTNAAAIYLRQSTEDDGKSYLWDEDSTT